MSQIGTCVSNWDPVWRWRVPTRNGCLANSGSQCRQPATKQIGRLREVKQAITVKCLILRQEVDTPRLPGAFPVTRFRCGQGPITKVGCPFALGEPSGESLSIAGAVNLTRIRGTRPPGSVILEGTSCQRAAPLPLRSALPQEGLYAGRPWPLRWQPPLRRNRFRRPIATALSWNTSLW